jgi:hypothetical protein
MHGSMRVPLYLEIVRKTAMKFIPARACALAVLLATAACAPEEYRETPIKSYPLDDIKGVVPRQAGITFDPKTSSDGNGSLRIDSRRTARIALFQTGDLDVEDALLIYRAQLRTAGVRGRAYLEMWCRFPGQGELFSRGLDTALTGDSDWTSVETPLLLKSGQNPDNVKLNLVIEGGGTVWIDDVQVLRATPP